MTNIEKNKVTARPVWENCFGTTNESVKFWMANGLGQSLSLYN